MTAPTDGSWTRHLPAWTLAALALAAPWAALAVVRAVSPAGYRALVQEDGPIEWATVVACVLAAAGHLLCARAERRRERRLPWFSLGLVLFCVLFAGEELSWGQRALSYRPPDYFLEHNAQQELNLHNLFKEVLRTKYLLILILAGWGVALPLAAALWARARGVLDRIGVRAPHAALVPGMIATMVLLAIYPWPYTGEVAECLFAVGLFLAAVLGPTSGDRRAPTIRAVLVGGAGVLLVGALGSAIPPLTSALADADDGRVAVATEETARLAQDWLAQLEADERLPSGCGTHVRVHGWVRSHDHQRLRVGHYAEGAPLDPRYEDEARRRYFLDPWNNPYWLWHRCEAGRQRVLLYSFGSDGRRDSSRGALGGDDVGAELSR